jgi:hypothetical protein
MIQTTREQELKDRLNLIETMIAEGRQTTESWGWSFVLWGIGYYVAIAWATWGHSSLAWPVTMLGTAALTGVFASRKNYRQPETTMGRAVSAIWAAVGTSLFLLLISTAISGRMEQHVFVAVIAAMLGAANAASSVILKWKAQFFAALVWWITAVVSCFGTVTQSSIVFLVAIFFGQIVFGGYMMISESRERKQGVAHA